MTEQEPEFKPHWEEFAVDKDGYFCYEGKRYYYLDNAIFDKRNNSPHLFKGFGGWCYMDGGAPIWSMTPRTITEDSAPAWAEPHILSRLEVPVKIRFWREVI